WNAEAAKFGLDINGDVNYGLGSYGFHGAITGEVVDEYTVDVVCDVDCPIFPRTAMFTNFAAPEWWSNASEAERSRNVIGIGPYRFLDWQSGVDVTLEAYEDYLSHDSYGSQAPSIQNVRQMWRNEAFVRASMVASGEADWANNIGFENADLVPQAIQSGTNEIYTLVPDTIWHPELSKKKVRMALAHAINCQEIVDTLYDGRMECHANISQPGTLADPPGASRVKPLRFGRRGLELFLNNFLVLQEPLETNHPNFQATLDVRRADYRRK
ncbi:MAG TPA: ABC transporter substrate-binding protein, partial [Dehalococcoidia bacterium]|nr:ABC transporter substrate-binding protein [Dehalococcoidia bacterium]